MTPIKLRIVSDNGIEATISSDGSQGGMDDYYAVVSVKGFTENKKIYGIDPVQSFVLGLRLIEKLTETRRIGDHGHALIDSASWRIEIDTV